MLIDYDLCYSTTPLEQWCANLSYSLESVPYLIWLCSLVFAKGVTALIEIGSGLGDEKDPIEAGVA